VTRYDYITELDPGFNEGKARVSLPAQVLEVYGTPEEARQYIAEEFGLPSKPPPVSVLPPFDIRSGPVRTVTIYPANGGRPQDELSGVDLGTRKWLLTMGSVVAGFVVARVAIAALDR